MGLVSDAGGKLPAVKRREAKVKGQASSQRDANNVHDRAADKIGAINRANAAAQRFPSLITISSGTHSRPVPVGARSKRTFDILVAGTTLLLMAPLMIIIAGLIIITMGHPVLLAQRRVGFNNNTFSRYKFRTLVSATGMQPTRNLQPQPEQPYWSRNQKLEEDAHITWFGHILLKSSLDKLPQLFNVLRGEMSCIGPSPVSTKDLTTQYGPAAKYYARARPGVISIGQVWGRGSAAYSRRVAYDSIYVRRWSLRLDMQIVFRTLSALLRHTM
jgi:exopolysaccharide production protein ExoY